MPALADMHVHLPEADKIDELLILSLAAGIAHIRVMNSKVDQLALKNQIAKEKQIKSEITH